MCMDLNEVLDRVKGMYLKFGIKSVTMDDVARELMISKKTLYQYVKDKNELVTKVIDRLIEEDSRQYCEIIQEDRNAIEQLFDVSKHIRQIMMEVSPTARYDLQKYYREQYGKLYKQKKEMMLQSVMDNLEKGKAEGLFRSDFSSSNLATFFVSRVENTIEMEFFMVESLEEQTFFIEVFEYHIRGLVSSKGLKFFEENINELKQQ